MIATAAELIDTARERTGLDDFGPDSFTEPLDILVGSLRTEARLNDTGELVLTEETGLVVHEWGELRWTVEVTFVDLDMPVY